MSLVSRHLEANGIPTVILGSARDIVEQCGVARFVFTDFPLGNPTGRPYDVAMQQAIVEYGFTLLESARGSRTTLQTPFVWDRSGAWRDNYMRVDEKNRDALRRMGDLRRRQQERRKSEGRARIT